MFEVGHRIMFDVTSEGDDMESYMEGEVVGVHTSEEATSYDIRVTAEKPDDGERYDIGCKVVYEKYTPANAKHLYDCVVCDAWRCYSGASCAECNDTGLSTREGKQQVRR